MAIFSKKNGKEDPEAEAALENNAEETQAEEPQAAQTEDPQKQALSAEAEKLNAVRDLLFGPSDREYKDEFAEIKDLIRSNKDETDQRLSDLEAKFTEKVDELDRRINDKIDDLDRRLNEKIDDNHREITDKS